MQIIKLKFLYTWLVTVMWITSFLPDFKFIMRFRGWLVKPCFRKVGRNFQVASGTKILLPHNIEIGNDVYFANYCWILGGKSGITIEDEVMFSPFVVVITGNHGYKNGSFRWTSGSSGHIRIGKGSWVASHATILQGVTIGAGSLVAANAAVTKDVEPGSIYGGVPAKKIGELQSLSNNNPNQ